MGVWVSMPGFISTHTPLAGCNGNDISNPNFTRIISTHTPLAGCNLNLWKS